MQLEVVNISQAFGRKRYVQDVSLHVSSGVRLGIIGKSGAGKTTLLRCLSGLTPITDGHIIYDGQPHKMMSRLDWRRMRHRMGFITQGVTLLSQRTVWQNIELAFAHRPHLFKDQAIVEMLEAVQLIDKAHAYPDELSGGQRQRVAIARALVHQPELVLCDEFTSALDSETTDDMLMLLRRLQREGMTFIFVTHDVHVVQAFAQHVVVMDQGRVVEEGSTQSVLTHPQHAITKSLMRLQQPCPRGVKNLVKDATLLKLVFGAESVGKPVLAEMMRSSPVEVNIVSGSLDALGDKPFGYLYVACPHQALTYVVPYLEERGVHVTVEQGGSVVSRTIAHVMTGKAVERAPMWLMRQAGRYLPEYRAFRLQFPDFMEFCATREAVVHVTMQPLKRWPFDGAIIFSDILIIPHVLGQKVRFLPDHGPQLDAPNWEDFLKQKLTKENVIATLGAIADVKALIPPTCTLFGFAGAPWTLLRYMFSGSRAGDGKALAAWGRTETGERVLRHLEDIIVDWLMFQLQAGCDVVQLFDSWAADVPENDREYWLWKPVQRIINRLPQHQVLYFAKGVEKEAATHLTGCAFGLGPSVDPVAFPNGHVLQGNLSPEQLVVGGFDNEVKRLLQGMAGKPYIFNLGHGVLPSTPIEHVDRLVELVQCM